MRDKSDEALIAFKKDYDKMKLEYENLLKQISDLTTEKTNQTRRASKYKEKFQ